MSFTLTPPYSDAIHTRTPMRFSGDMRRDMDGQGDFGAFNRIVDIFDAALCDRVRNYSRNPSILQRMLTRPTWESNTRF